MFTRLSPENCRMLTQGRRDHRWVGGWVLKRGEGRGGWGVEWWWGWRQEACPFSPRQRFLANPPTTTNPQLHLFPSTPLPTSCQSTRTHTHTCTTHKHTAAYTSTPPTWSRQTARHQSLHRHTHSLNHTTNTHAPPTNTQLHLLPRLRPGADKPHQRLPRPRAHSLPSIHPAARRGGNGPEADVPVRC
jgi:hypothetical protein